jgi:riboflavin synthase
MFTGIVEELGEVVAVERPPGAEGTATLTIRGRCVTADAAHGASIAVNGVCLTVTGVAGGAFTADVMAETLRCSSLGVLDAGTPVNLERPVRPDGRLSGHIVQGHVDGTGTIVSRAGGQRDEVVVRIGLPPGLSRYVVEKGSVAVDGISLTVSAASEGPASEGAASAGTGPDGAWFEVSLIPVTLQLTTLGRKQPGDPVNLEVDIISKYVEKLLNGSARS